MSFFNLISLIFFSQIFIPIHGMETLKTYEWYDEELVVDKMLPMAAAAFGEQKRNFENCVGKTFKYAMFLNFTTIDCALFDFKTDDHCAAFVAVSKSDRAIILSFRGTQNPIQFLDMVSKTFVFQKPAAPAGTANRYFVQVIQKFENTGLFDQVKFTVDAFPLYELWVTGASLGGALASLGAGLLVQKYGINDKNVKLVTFAQPRTGNHEWAMAMDKIIPYKYRIVQGKDIVPHVPLQSVTDWQIAEKMRISFPNTSPLSPFYRDYLHWKGEIWYPEGTKQRGNFILCNGTNEDENCSNKNFNLLKLVGSVIEDIKNGCLKAVHAGRFKSFSMPDINEAFDKMLDRGDKFMRDGAKLMGRTAAEMYKSADNLVTDVYKCVEGGIKGGWEGFKEIAPEHNTYFGIDFKYYGGRGCPR